MRRVAIAGALLVLFALASPVSGTGDFGYYKDDFNSVSFDGNDGTLSWSGPWQEWNDFGGPLLGNVTVGLHTGCHQGLCLQIAAPLGNETVGAYRAAEVSTFTEVEISYYVGGHGLVADNGASKLELEVRLDGGAWARVDQVVLQSVIGKEAKQRKVVVEPGGADFMMIRFSVAGVVGYEAAVDSVKILGTSGTGSPTTTTTTSPTTNTTIRATTTTTTRATTTTTTRATTITTTSIPSATTTTTRATTTTVVVDRPDLEGDEGSLAGGSGQSSPLGGMRYASSGIQAGFTTELYAGVFTPEAVGLEADYRMAVEMVEANALGLVVLAGLIVLATISGTRTALRPRRPDLTEGA